MFSASPKITSSCWSGVDSQGNATAIVGQVLSRVQHGERLEHQLLLMRHAPGRGRPTTDGTDRVRHPANTDTLNLKRCLSHLAGTTRRLLRMSSVSVRTKTAPISSIHSMRIHPGRAWSFDRLRLRLELETSPPAVYNDVGSSVALRDASECDAGPAGCSTHARDGGTRRHRW